MTNEPTQPLPESVASKFLLYTVDEVNNILTYAGEGRTNCIKPDLLANALNIRLAQIFNALAAPIQELISKAEKRILEQNEILVSVRLAAAKEAAHQHWLDAIEQWPSSRSDTWTMLISKFAEKVAAAPIQELLNAAGEKGRLIGREQIMKIMDLQGFGGRSQAINFELSIAAAESRGRDAGRLEEAEWWADHDIEDMDTQDQWDEIARHRVAEIRALKTSAPEVKS